MDSWQKLKYPECSCRISKLNEVSNPVKDSNGERLHGGEEECPPKVLHGVAKSSLQPNVAKDEVVDAGELLEDDIPSEGNDDTVSGSILDSNRSSEQDEEMDPDD